jgi:DNA modification methylase
MTPKIEQVAVADLIPYASNSRTHSDAQIAQIAASIREFGWTNPILVDGDNGLIAGHGRLLAARKLGMEIVPAIILDHLTKAQQRALVIADNQLALNAGGDIDMLKAEIEDLKLEDFDLGLLGFDDKFLDGLLEPEPTEGLTDEDAVPEVPAVPKTVLGDVWVLGNHRLMCGDSTSIDAVEKLMDGVKADMVFTDPPYNIGSENKGVAANVSKAHKDLMAAEWDKNFEIEAPLNCVLTVMAKDCAVYVCTSHHLAGRIWSWMKEWADHYSYCVWSKPDPMPSLMKRHWTWDTELIPYATRGKHIFNAEIGLHSPSTWRINKQQGSEKTGHPTQKPVAVPQHAIEKSSRNNQIVLDLFGGSGSTLIACEKTNRHARLMELDPKYCDVIVKRWQDFTGQQAVHAETGEAFESMSAAKDIKKSLYHEAEAE